MARLRAWRGWSPGKKPLVHGMGPDRRKREGAVMRWRQRRRVREIIREIDPELFTGQRGVVRDAQACARLFEAVTRDTDAAEYRRRHNFLVKVLNRGCRERGWDIPCPGPIAHWYPERPAFDMDSARLHARLRRIDDRHERAIRDLDWLAPEDKHPYLARAGYRLQQKPTLADLAAGQVLYQAIRHGGLLARPAIRGFGQKSLESLTLDADGTVTLDIPLAGRRFSKLPPRRFYPDPVTGLLLLGYRRRWDRWPLKEADRLLWLYLRGLGITLPSGSVLAGLCEGAALGLQLERGAPPFLVRYARDGHWSPSLPRQAWIHLTRDRVERLGPPPRPSMPPPDRYQAATARAPARDVLAVRQAIPDSIKDTQRREAAKHLQQFLREHGAPGTLPTWLAEWARHLLAPHSEGGRGVRVSTATTYLGAIARPLQRELVRLEREHETDDPLDLAGLAEDEWQTLYDRVLNGAVSPYNRHRRAFLLTDFHRYLRNLDTSIPPVDIENSAADPEAVDANLVPPPAFNRAVRVIRKATRDARIRRISELLLVLGYRLGLRREEAAGLSLADVITGGLDRTEDPSTCLAREPQLLVRSNHWRVLKSDTGSRRLPIAALLTPAELKMLLGWHADRLQETNSAPEKTRLFTLAAHEDTRIPEAIFLRITRALQIVCGDRSIRYHHLRHSMASLLILRCLAHRYPDAIPGTWLRQGKKHLMPLPDGSLPARLLGRDDPVTPDSRRLLQLASGLLGHIDPQTTVGSYLHTLDRLLGMAVREADPSLSPRAQAVLMGRPPKRQWERRTRARQAGIKLGRTQPASTLLKLLARKPGLVHAKPSLSGTRPPLTIAKAADELDRRSSPLLPKTTPMLIYQVLRDVFTGEKHKNVAFRHAVPTDDVIRWHATAKRLCQQHYTQKERPRLAREPSTRMASINPEKQPALPGLCPAPPRSREGRKEALDVFNRLTRWCEHSPERALPVLEQYLNQATLEEADITVRDDADFLSFIRFFEQAGIDLRRIQLRVRPNLADWADTPAVQRHYWAKALNLPHDQVHHDNDIWQSPTTKHPMGRTKLYLCDNHLKNPDRSKWSVIRFALFTLRVEVDSLVSY